MSRLRRGAVVAAAAAVAGTVAARRRWSAADDPTSGLPLELPAGRERTVRTADGARIAAWEMGDERQPVIVLAHGWTADRRVWASVARRLVAAGRHVVVYDQRGHGASTVGADGLSIEALADDLRAVLDDLDATGAVVAGHSMGGMTAQLFAITHPDVLARRVAGLVLVSTAASKMSYGPAYLRMAAHLMGSPVLQRLMALDALGPSLVRSSHGRGVSMVALRGTLTTWLATPAEVRSGFIDAIGRLDLLAGLASIEVPTVVVSGSRDTLTLPARSRDIVAALPGARLEVLHGLGHQLVFEAPDQLADLIGDAAGPLRSSAPGATAPGATPPDAPNSDAPNPRSATPDTALPPTVAAPTGGPR